MWGTIPAGRLLREYESREAELMTTEIWGDMIDKEATIMRYKGEER